MNDVLVDGIVVLGCIGLVINAITMIRNTRVLLYRKKVLGVIFYGDWSKIEERLAEFKSVSFHKMVYMFWKPLDSFFSEDLRPPK
jgi:hypothetical protein